MILGLDFDSTLVKSFTADPLPGVAARIAALPADQCIFIATNQAGPTFGSVLGSTTYPTALQTAERLFAGLDGVGLFSRRNLLVLVAVAAPQQARSERASLCVAEELAV